MSALGIRSNERDHCLARHACAAARQTHSLSYAAFSPSSDKACSRRTLNRYITFHLTFDFRMGRETYGEREGLLAAGMFAALLPSFYCYDAVAQRPTLVVLTCSCARLCEVVDDALHAGKKVCLRGALGGGGGGVAVAREEPLSGG